MNNRKYINDYGILRAYGEQTFKLVGMACYRQKGIEDDKHKFTAKGEAGNITKLSNSISRTKNKIFELAWCNPWEWFVTFTLDPQKYDRYDLSRYIKDLSQFIRDYKKKTKHDVKYLLVPEHHKDGAWHLHGLIMGLPVECLHQFSASEKLPMRILDRINSGKDVYTFPDYERKFGYCVFEAIENNEAISKYITKYITKDMLSSVKELNAHCYYSSKGLQHSIIINQDILAKAIEAPDFQNEHCSIKWFDSIDEAAPYFAWEVEA